jgi:hypothetical protein
MKLFVVEEIFSVSGKGVILTPGFPKHIEKPVLIGSKIRLIKPDKSEIITEITGIDFKAFYNRNPILIGNKITKEEIPVGTEVWLIEE